MHMTMPMEVRITNRRFFMAALAAAPLAAGLPGLAWAMRGKAETMVSLGKRTKLEYLVSHSEYKRQSVALEDCTLVVTSRFSPGMDLEPQWTVVVRIPLMAVSTGKLDMAYPDRAAWNMTAHTLGDIKAIEIVSTDLGTGRVRKNMADHAIIDTRAGKDTAKAGKDFLHLVRLCGGGVQNEYTRRFKGKE